MGKCEGALAWPLPRRVVVASVRLGKETIVADIAEARAHARRSHVAPDAAEHRTVPLDPSALGQCRKIRGDKTNYGAPRSLKRSNNLGKSFGFPSVRPTRRRLWGRERDSGERFIILPYKRKTIFFDMR